MTGLSFCLSTMIGSIISTHFSEIWYGIGLVVGCPSPKVFDRYQGDTEERMKES